MSEARAQSQPTFSEALWALIGRELSGGRLVLDEIAHLFSKEVGATASVVRAGPATAADLCGE